ncbi:MAG: alpha-amylase family glycosyl hydrolase [Desulfotomaculaceae bacterium]|nr:alpha-amylase family glycosyl hydrolase [Desulfotomaculaceae bacterium]
MNKSIQALKGMVLMNRTQGISQADIIYFIITDRFCGSDASHSSTDGGKPSQVAGLNKLHGGNFAGILSKIPYLKHLGVTALWITPVYLSISGLCGAGGLLEGYHGYWALDFERVDDHLITVPGKNGREQLKELVAKLHAHGIKVILDVVVSHTGYHNGNYEKYPRRLPSGWFKNKEECTLYGLPELDHRLADVRDYFVNNIIDWIEDTNIDAIRLDSARHIDQSFWYYFKSYVRGKYRNVFFLGEVLDFDAGSVAKYQREFDFDSLFDFPLCGNIIDVMIRNEDYKPPEQRRGMTALAGPRHSALPEVSGVLDTDWKYNNANRLVTLVDNHDLEKRIMSWALLYAGGDSNQAAGLVVFVLSFLFTTRGIPQVYYGTEVGMEGDCKEGGDAYLRRDMPWEKIDQKTQEPYPGCVVESFIYRRLRQLIKIRLANEALQYGYLFTLYSDFDCYVFMREFRGNTILVALNNSPDPAEKVIEVEVAVNPNIPQRIKNDLAGRQVLVNLMDKQEKFQYVSPGILKIKVKGKQALILKLL